MYLQPSPCLSSRTAWLERLEADVIAASSASFSFHKQQWSPRRRDLSLLSSSSSLWLPDDDHHQHDDDCSNISAVATIMAAKQKQALWEIQVIRDQIMAATETMDQVLREIFTNVTSNPDHSDRTGPTPPPPPTTTTTCPQDWEVAHRLATQLDCLEYKLKILVQSYRLQHGEKPPAPGRILFHTFGLTMSDVKRHFQLFAKSDLAHIETNQLGVVLGQLDRGQYHQNDDFCAYWQAQSDEWKGKFGSVPVIQTEPAENREVLVERIVAYLCLSDE